MFHSNLEHKQFSVFYNHFKANETSNKVNLLLLTLVHYLVLFDFNYFNQLLFFIYFFQFFCYLLGPLHTNSFDLKKNIQKITKCLQLFNNFRQLCVYPHFDFIFFVFFLLFNSQ